MRTTLTIDDNLLAAAKAVACQTNRTIGEVLSDLARTALPPKTQPRERNGIPLLPVRNPDAIVTPEIVNALRDELPGRDGLGRSGIAPDTRAGDGHVSVGADGKQGRLPLV
jgi:hypothetical protein